MKSSVVIPVYNEIQMIHEIIKRVQKVHIEKELIIVDDCSTDGTREYLRTLRNDEDSNIFFHDSE